MLASGGGEAPTKENIGTAMNWLNGMAAGDDDTVRIYFSGHGYSDRNGSYLVTAESDPKNLLATGLNVTIFNKMVADIPARRKIVILDACHAGGMSGMKGGGMGAGMFRDLNANSQGQIRVLSCKQDELSYESDAPGLKQGVFSYYLVRGLGGEADANHDGLVTFGELQDFVASRVRDWAGRHKVRQTPTFEERSTGVIVVSGGSK